MPWQSAIRPLMPVQPRQSGCTVRESARVDSPMNACGRQDATTFSMKLDRSVSFGACRASPTPDGRNQREVRFGLGSRFEQPISKHSGRRICRCPSRQSEIQVIGCHQAYVKQPPELTRPQQIFRVTRTCQGNSMSQGRGLERQPHGIEFQSCRENRVFHLRRMEPLAPPLGESDRTQ